MKTTFIYILWDPRQNYKCYIGKALNPLNRLHTHLTSLEGKTKKKSWIKKLISLGLKPELEILDNVPYNEDGFWEKYYISLYKSWNFELTNSTIGGDGGATRTGCKQSIEEISKRVKTRKNNGKPWASNQQKEKARENAKGNKNRLNKPFTEESKQKISKSKKESITEEFRERMREVNLGNTNRKGKKLKGENKLNKPVTQFDLEEATIMNFKSYSEALEKTGIKGIANCLSNRAKTAGGYIWRYATTV